MNSFDSPEYNAAVAIRRRCLIEDGSYLFPDQNIWTKPNLRQLQEALAAEEMTVNGGFIARLVPELAAFPSAITALAAEASILYYLFPHASTLKPETKVARVTEILRSRDLDVPTSLLRETFNQGLGNVGTFYLAAQKDIIACILAFAELGKLERIDFESPSAAAAVFDSLSELRGSATARHAVLHLLYPTQYEPIVSDSHKRKIVQKYSDLIDPSDDIDESLRRIRSALETRLGRSLSFYERPLEAEWNQQPEKNLLANEARIPGYQAIMLPLLQLLADAARHKESDLIPQLGASFFLTDEDLQKKFPSGADYIFSNRVRWAKVNLRQAGLVEIPSEGYVRITERGRELLSEQPQEITRNSLRRYPEYVEFLERDNSTGLESPRAGNVWIEKTIVEGRPDRMTGEMALGRMLWSPQKNEAGRDIYRFIRDIQPGDVILHLTDNKGFTGISVAERAYEQFEGVEGTEWGRQSSYRVRLRDFRRLEPPLLRETFFAPPYADRLRQLRRSGKQNLFFTDSLALVQGGYLTPAPPELVTILNDAYTDLTGRPLVESPVAYSEAPQTTYSFEELLRTTLWSEDALNEILDAVTGEHPSRQIVLTGPPGTGKTFVAQQIVRYLTSSNPSRMELVQFHPSYSYEQFIEGFKPELVDGALQFRPSRGIVLQMAGRCRERNAAHFLIIDEMNRANLPRVFGELMYLFEYRDETIQLPYSGEFSLPKNLFFLGTMNTADRSIRSIDIALRRRFEVFECPPDRGILEKYYQLNTNQVSSLFDGFDQLNQRLTQMIDRHHTIGHTFFMHPVLSPKLLATVWRRKIAPLLEEYLFDQPEELATFELSSFWPEAS